MAKIDNWYKGVLNEILFSDNSFSYQDPNRKGVERTQIPNVEFKWDVINDPVPIVSLRKTYFKGAIGELLLFLKGSTDIRDYWKYGISFWDQDLKVFNRITDEGLEYIKERYKKNEHVSKKFTNMGKFYAFQYKKQHSVFDKLKENPYRTDLIVNSWQVDDLKEMCLIPCHFQYQFYKTKEGFGLYWTTRSQDFLLGNPINILFYYLMGKIVEIWSGIKFTELKGNLTNVHLYDNQYELAKEMIELDDSDLSIPKLNIKSDNWDTSLSFSEFIKTIEPEDFELLDYSYKLDKKVPMLAYDKDSGK